MFESLSPSSFSFGSSKHNRGKCSCSGWSKAQLQTTPRCKGQTRTPHFLYVLPSALHIATQGILKQESSTGTHLWPARKLATQQEARSEASSIFTATPYSSHHITSALVHRQHHRSPEKSCDHDCTFREFLSQCLMTWGRAVHAGKCNYYISQTCIDWKRKLNILCPTSPWCQKRWGALASRTKRGPIKSHVPYQLLLGEAHLWGQWNQSPCHYLARW